MVVKRGVNETSVVPMARHFRERGAHPALHRVHGRRHTNGWRMDDVVPAAEIVAADRRRAAARAGRAQLPGEVAKRWRYRDGSGEIGVIASVTQPFCGDCTRARLSAEGELYTCLFARRGHDLRALLRGGASDEELDGAIAAIWRVRADRYSELRTAADVDARRRSR